MMPAVFVRLDALPLTPTGKVDRQALPAPGRERPGGDAGYVRAARGRSSEALARIWGEVLGLDRVGVQRQPLRAGRPLADRLADRQPRPRRARPGAAAARGLHQPHGGGSRRAPGGAGVGRGERRGRRAAGGRCRRSSASTATARCRSRSPRSGSGSSTSWRPAPSPTTSSSPSASAAALAAGTLRRALREVVRRHEILRTSFPAFAGRPLQAIHADWPAAGRGCRRSTSRRSPAPSARGSPRLGADGDPPRLRRHPAAAGALAAAAARRATTTCCSTSSTTSCTTAGRSPCCCERSRSSTAPSSTAGPSPLPELAIQYADFAVWQRRVAGAARCWTSSWPTGGRGSPARRGLELPTDRPRPRRSASAAAPCASTCRRALYDAGPGASAAATASRCS